MNKQKFLDELKQVMLENSVSFLFLGENALAIENDELKVTSKTQTVVDEQGIYINFYEDD